METAKINVLSLFDGMSCGQIALDQSGIEVDKYYASEIDKYAIEITKKNYPNTMHVGDVTKVDGTQLDKIDLLIGGSPCQGFSFAGKQLNFNDPRSALFFEFVRLLKETKPKYFLLENVRMKKEFQDIITEYLGVEPIMINSSLLSAQNRVRFYWTNIPNVTQPIDKGIVINDILEEAPDMSRKGGSLESYFDKHKDQPIFSKDGLCHVGNAEINGNESIKRVYHPDGKAPTLTTMQGGHREPKILCAALRGRQITKGSKEYTQMLEVRDDGKTNTLTTIQKDNVVTVDNKYYRKLTPLECERLQTVLQYIKPVEIVLCSDQAKSFVLAVEKNPKLLKLVLSAESKELKEYVKPANQNMSVSQASKKYTAHQYAGTATLSQTRKCIRGSQGEKSLTVSSAVHITTCKQAEIEEASVIQSVFMNITEGKTTHYGREELLQTEQSYTELMGGKIVLNLSGKETLQNADDVLKAIEIMQTNQHSTSITSFRLSTKNLEQMLIISYWFAKNAITGFTHDTIKTKTLYLNLIDGYTNHVSNSQRYKMIGNGWTVAIIKHIFRGIKNETY